MNYITHAARRVKGHNHFVFFWVQSNVLRTHDVAATWKNIPYVLAAGVQQLNVVCSKPAHQYPAVLCDVDTTWGVETVVLVANNVQGYLKITKLCENQIFLDFGK